jgi:hypothetical protein
MQTLARTTRRQVTTKGWLHDYSVVDLGRIRSGRLRRSGVDRVAADCSGSKPRHVGARGVREAPAMMPTASLASGRPMTIWDTHGAAVTSADATAKPAQGPHALDLMRSYVVDCAREKDEGAKRRTEELNGVICACVERLAVDRQGGGVREPRLAPDALSYALRYIDEHIGTNLLDDLGSKLRTDAQAFGPRFKLPIGTSRCRSVDRYRFLRARKLLRNGTTRLADIALEASRSFHRR